MSFSTNLMNIHVITNGIRQARFPTRLGHTAFVDIIMFIMAISYQNRWSYRKISLSLPTIKIIKNQIT